MESYNPWWIGDPDPFYEEWKNSPIKWVPKIVDSLILKPYSLYFIIGPRQVGKTTALKIFIHKILRNRNPRSVFYYSCDELVDYEELGEVLDNYISFRNIWGIKNSVIVLDEITFVEEWFRAIKSRIDKGVFRNDILIITGSASIELLVGKERFPGRRGYGKDLYMYPLSFRKYIEIFSSPNICYSDLEDWEKFEKCISANKVFIEKINSLFESYLKTGGFPLPIKEFFSSGRITYVSYRTVLDWLRTDWLKMGKKESYMKEVLAYLLDSSLTPLSWHSIARNTSLLSPHTVREYVEMLEELMVLRILFWSSPYGKIDYRKNKKMFFIDPFLYYVFSQYCNISVDTSSIVEATVLSHLSRRYDVYYWRNSTEIDALVSMQDRIIAFEVKWTRKPKRGRRPINTYVLDREKIPLFLASLA